MTRVGIFGDSYVDSRSFWTQRLAEMLPEHELDVRGKGGSNLYYAIDQYRIQIQHRGPDWYDVVIFTLTWPQRLYSAWPYRNEQFCSYSEQRPWVEDWAIQDEASNQEFLASIPQYYRYIHDQAWREFDWELEIRWVLDLAQTASHRLIVIPNTEQSREIARRHHRGGILMDMAMETISNLEPGSPGAMPVRDPHRNFHLNDANHWAMARLMAEAIRQAPHRTSFVWPVDFNQFDLVQVP
jgi:hypothetical protein